MSYLTKTCSTAKPPVTFEERPWGDFSQYAFNDDCTVSSIIEGDITRYEDDYARVAKGE
jgi:hypothetical protein